MNYILDTIVSFRLICDGNIPYPTFHGILSYLDDRALFLDEEMKTLDHLPNIIEMIVADESLPSPSRHHRGCFLLRKLSCAIPAPVDAILNTGVLPHLFHVMQHNPKHPSIFDVSWVLTNLTCGSSDTTVRVIEAGIIPILVPYLDHAEEDIRDQTVWTFGNICGEGGPYQAQCISHGLVRAMEYILQKYPQHLKLESLRILTWTVANVCRHNPDIPPLIPLIPKLTEIVRTSTDNDSLIDAYWALNYMSAEASGVGRRHLKECGVTPLSLLRLIQGDTPQTLLSPALALFRNLIRDSSIDDNEDRIEYFMPVLRLLATGNRHKHKMYWKMLVEISHDIVIRDIGVSQSLMQNPNVWKVVESAFLQNENQSNILVVVRNIICASLALMEDMILNSNIIRMCCDHFDALIDEITLLFKAIGATAASGQRVQEYHRVFLDILDSQFGNGFEDEDGCPFCDEFRRFVLLCRSRKKI